MKRFLLVVVAAVGMASRFPPGSNVVDPRAFGAVLNDGVVDTVAFQDAIAAAVGVGHIYEITGAPGDVYEIDAPLKAQILHNGVMKWTNNWVILCDPGVIIRIPDNSPAFGNAAAPQALFQYGSTTLSSPTAPPASGGGNEGYRNSFDGKCTIDLGRGNPGARGIDWVANNRAAIRDVIIRSGDGNCDAGIWAGRPWPGPALVEGVEVEGCRNGIWDGFTQYGLTVRNSYFHGQSLYAVNATADATVLDGVRSVNAAPALRVESPAGFATVLNSTFEGGVSTKGAIQLGTQSKVYIRDSTATGYGALVRQGTVLRGDVGMTVAEWTSHPGFSPSGTPASLRLPAHDPPRVFDSTDPGDWANVRDFGGSPIGTGDDLPAIEAAIATGRPILQLDQDLSGLSTYYVSNTINLPCSVRRVEGMESRLVTTSTFPSGNPLFRLAADCDWSDVTTIERVWTGGRFGPMVEHVDPRTLYLKDGYFAASSTGIWARPGSGWLFLSNVVTKHLQVEGPHSVWAWQLNPEGFAAVGVAPIPSHGIVNNGGDVRLVGVKTEGKPTFTVGPGGRTELLGAMLMPCVGEGQNDVVGPGFTVAPGGRLSGNWTNWCGKAFDLATWDVQVEEGTFAVTADQLPSYTVEGGWRVFMPLYSSPQGTCNP